MTKNHTERAANGGVQRIYRFENGYGASVVRNQFSFGGREGLWELAVVHFPDPTKDRFHLNYDTPITGDVLGHLTWEEVEVLLERVEELEAKE